MNEDRTHRPTQRYFLDTSSAIAFHWGKPELKVKVLRDLGSAERHSSAYVECQYKTLILNSFMLIHAIVETSRTTEEALQRIEGLKESAYTLMAHELGKKLFEKNTRIGQLISRLERIIESDWHTYFRAATQGGLCDFTGCTLASDAPQRRGRFYVSISSQCPGGCRIRAFWERMSVELHALASLDTSRYGITDDPKDTMPQIKAEAQSIIEGRTPESEACRKVMDDSIIALEAREGFPGMTVHTLDHHFELLGPVLHVPVKIPE